ncbi:MAG: type VI secretion protein, partial [Proteobacteria bacterium]
MIRRTMLTAAIAGCTVSATPVSAGGLPVFDSATYLQTLSTVRNTLALIDQARAQVGEAQRLYQSMNRLTQVNSLG